MSWKFIRMAGICVSLFGISIVAKAVGGGTYCVGDGTQETCDEKGLLFCQSAAEASCDAGEVLVDYQCGPCTDYPAPTFKDSVETQDAGMCPPAGMSGVYMEVDAYCEPGSAPTKAH